MFLDVWMELCKNKLSEEDGTGILGECILKTCFFCNYPWELKFLNEVSR